MIGHEIKLFEPKVILYETWQLVREKGWHIGNIDTIVCLQYPKLAPHIIVMRKAIAGVLECDIDLISVKATTTEKLGFEGRGEGISAHAVVLLKKG